MRANWVTGALLLAWLGGCKDRVDYLELVPADVELATPEDRAWLEAHAMRRNGVRAVQAAIAWSTTNPAIATVDSKGQVTPVADGETEVVARAGGVEARAPVHVAYVDRVQVTPVELDLRLGQDPVSLDVVGFRRSGQRLAGRKPTFVVGDGKVAKVVGNGAIRPVGPGKTVVEVRLGRVVALVPVTVEKD